MDGELEDIGEGKRTGEGSAGMRGEVEVESKLLGVVTVLRGGLEATEDENEMTLEVLLPRET